MKKTITVLFFFLIMSTLSAQTVYQKDRWGAKLFYIEDNTMRQKDRWGDKLLFFDEQTIRQKDRWGQPVYYFDFEPTKWQMAVLILL